MKIQMKNVWKHEIVRYYLLQFNKPWKQNLELQNRWLQEWTISGIVT